MKSFFVLLLACAVCNAQIQVKVKNVTAIAGDEKVEIPCDYETDISGNPTIEWYDVNNVRLYSFKKNDQGNTFRGAKTDKDLDITDNGYLVINEAKVTHNLDLSVLTCVVKFDDETSARASLNFMVVKLPTNPAIMQINQYDGGFEGFEIATQKISLGFCRSDFTYPAPSIQFLRITAEGQEELIDGESIDDTDDLGDFGLFLDSTIIEDGPDGISKNAEKQLLKVLDKDDHQANFTCRVQTKYGDKVDTQDYLMPKFNVLYSTDTVELKADKQFAYEGDMLTLMCIANGFPKPVVKINGETMDSVTIKVSADVDGKTYSCTGNNNGEDDIASNEYTISVLSLKEPIITGETEVKLGQSLTVTCVTGGTPEPSVAWFFNDAKAQDGGTLTIPKASFLDSGTYTCKASNGHEYLEKSVDHMVTVKGLELLGDEEEMVSGKKEEEVELECAVQSDTDTTFSWTGTEDIPLTTLEGKTYTSTVKEGPLTTELSEKVITCMAENKDGIIVTKTFKLPYFKEGTKQPVIEAASAAPIGIIIAILVILLIVAIVLAVMYSKGMICKKQEKGDETAADIAVEINKDDLEAGNGKAEEFEATEEEKLMNNGDGMRE